MRRLLLALALLIVAGTPAFARSSQDRASIGSDITIADGETAGDIACAFCTVRVHGEVKGDIATFLGSVVVDSGRTISGDVASLGGDLEMGQDASVGGDVAIAAGDLKLGDGAAIHGQRTVLPGRLWLLLPLAPFLILAGLIWLIVSIVRRNRYPYPVPPRGRGF
ncbi:polymer-forming cytoskeletal protein [Tunturibacter empetritectus]|uniref:Polymer-forming cytoskeletal protein n=1 Tax=Tunturiibacter empetritectus TaxID=3069691 RepID=A0A7W8MRV6_9BACT|nr:polymer-forming cytoskeletal protein [Edaphobacter lichenicola]MBB5318236.1 hypothetical protein [Edaphobacter lichenicola]